MKIAKQIIIVRKDLFDFNAHDTIKAGAGKLAAQVAHASMAPILEKMRGVSYTNYVAPDYDYSLQLNLKKEEALTAWLEGSFRKIVVYVKNEEQLLKKFNELKEAGIICSLIKDSGFTVFSEPTNTCIGVEPMFAEDIDKYTGRLRLLN